MILILDNYDSFTYNLVQYVGSINKNIRVVKNDELTVNQIIRLNISHLIMLYYVMIYFELSYISYIYIC